jgi:hypothetical protein
MNRFLHCLLLVALLSLAACAGHDRLLQTACEADASLPLQTYLPASDDNPYSGMYKLWMVVANAEQPQGMEPVNQGDIIGQGKTGMEGSVRLDPAQQRALAKAYCAKRPLWLVTDDSVRRIKLFRGKPDKRQCRDKDTTLCIGYDVSTTIDDPLLKTACNADATLPLRIRLPSDPTDMADSYMPWVIVAGDNQPAGMAALEGGELVGEGETDEDGILQLNPAQARTLAQAYCAKKPLWLLYPGQTIEVELRGQSRRNERCNNTYTTAAGMKTKTLSPAPSLCGCDGTIYQSPDGTQTLCVGYKDIP